MPRECYRIQMSKEAPCHGLYRQHKLACIKRERQPSC